MRSADVRVVLRHRAGAAVESLDELLSGPPDDLVVLSADGQWVGRWLRARRLCATPRHGVYVSPVKPDGTRSVVRVVIGERGLVGARWWKALALALVDPSTGEDGPTPHGDDPSRTSHTRRDAA